MLRIWRLFVTSCLIAVCMGATPSVASATTSSSVSLGAFGASQMIVDGQRSHVLIAGTETNSIDVLSYSGKLVSVIPGEVGVSDMIIEGSTLYVADTGTNEIDAVDLNTFHDEGPVATGLTDLLSIAFAHGELWASLASPQVGFQADTLDSIDLATGVVTSYSSDFYPGYPALTTTPSLPDDLFLTERGVSPGEIIKVSVATGAPVVVATSSGTPLPGLDVDSNVTPDGKTLVGEGYYNASEFDTNTMLYNGVSFGLSGEPWPESWDTAGGLIAVEFQTDEQFTSQPNVFVYRLNNETPVFSETLSWAGLSSSLIALSPDGSTLFAVAADGTLSTTGEIDESLFITRLPSSVVDDDLGLTNVPSAMTTDATGPSGAVVTYPAPTVSDADDSTVPTPVCTPPSGSIFPIGITTVTCTVSDPDDSNSPVTASFTVTVKGADSQLADLDQAVQAVGTGTSLGDKLNQAQTNLAAGDVHDTCSILTAFMNEVRAQSGKHVATTVATQILANSERIETVLAC